MVGATDVGRLSSEATRLLPTVGENPNDAKHVLMICVSRDEPGGHARKLHEKNAELGCPGITVEIMKSMISYFKIVVAPPEAENREAAHYSLASLVFFFQESPRNA